jgi:nitroimidazol reductase NimA-like FMN-containing flavoprotein (pyridoxamine 5'-phosphate oxidase superfamily)
MHETASDIEDLQALLDRSFAGAGAHLLRIADPGRRMDAAEIAERMTGIRLLVLATTTADGRPIAGAVDGIFYRGAFHFGSAPDSLRFRHIRERIHVSAVHLPGEELSITVHGRARLIDIDAPEHAELRRTVVGIYAPRFGAEWEQRVLGGARYARIEPERMFTFRARPEDLQ